MKQILHMHTVRCKHASGTEEEYIQHALRYGITDLGFSDHTPLPGWFTAGKRGVQIVRMEPEELANYAETVRALGEKYAGRVKIRLGLEAEYAPSFFGELQEMIRPYRMDYLLLGQHFLREGTYFTLDPTDDAALLKEYVDSVLEGVSTGAFAAVAHPDLIHFTGDTALYADEMHRLCEGLKRFDMPVEINLHGLDGNRNYPDDRFWRIAAGYGLRTMIGPDAHQTDEVFRPALYERALEKAREWGVNLVDTAF